MAPPSLRRHILLDNSHFGVNNVAVIDYWYGFDGVNGGVVGVLSIEEGYLVEGYAIAAADDNSPIPIPRPNAPVLLLETS